nr:hypothetical protein GCM10020063_085200 [Dactylosporangium thailandense]
MTTDRLKRSPIQTLFRNMPGQPYPWATSRHRGGAIGGNPRTTSPLDVPEEWLVERLRRLVEPFTLNGLPNAPAVGAVIDRGQYRLVTALDLTATRFPNTFLCETCDYFRQTTGPSGTCPRCKRALMQFNWVYTHTCGEMAELSAPRTPCPKGHRGSWRLQNWRERGARWVWRCNTCGAPDGRSVSTLWCRSCGNGSMILGRSTAQGLHYPQQLTVLNPPTRSEHAGLASAHLGPAALAQTLGAMRPGKKGLREAGLIADSDGEQLVRQTAAKLGLESDDPLVQQLLNKARGSADAGPAWRAAVDDLNLDPDRLRVAGDECLQLTLARDADALTLGELRNTVAAEQRPAIDHLDRRLHAEFGIAEVTLLRTLPIAYVIAGFTRGSSRSMTDTKRGPQPVGFRYFPSLGDGRIPMYGIRSDTEGLLFRLDPVEIVRWLSSNGYAPKVMVDSEGDAQRWMLSNLEPVTDIFEPPSHGPTAAALTLVHSVAHRMMKSLAARCGLNIDSLAEYLFPLTGSFLIYANTRSQFTLGGLEHVFRYDLSDALTELKAETRCLFDPVCRDREAACVACLHVSEISCARFNSALSRNVLFGAPQRVTPSGTARGAQWIRFWSP